MGWSAWFNKLRWQLISFKLQAFWTFIFLLVGSGIGLVRVYRDTLKSCGQMFKAGYLTQDGLANIIINIQKVLFETAFSNILTFFGLVLGAVIAVKGVSYYTNTQAVKSVLENKPEQVSGEDLRQYLDKRSE